MVEINNIIKSMNKKDDNLTEKELNKLKKIIILPDNIKPVISHEIKHIFDVLISNAKQNKKLLKSFDGNSRNYFSHNSDLMLHIGALSDLLYYFNAAEESAHQQQLIEEIKSGIFLRKDIEEFLYNLNKCTINNRYLDESNENVIGNFSAAINFLKNAYKTIDNLSNENISELCTIIKQYEISETLIGKKFIGSTSKDIKIFYNKCFDKFKQYIINMLKKATKHLV